MSVDTKDLKHIVFFGGAAWGHARSAIHCAITLCMKSPNLALSLLFPEAFMDRAKDTIDFMLTQETADADLAKDVHARLHLVVVIPPKDYVCPPELEASLMRPFQEASAAFVARWEQLHKDPQQLPRPSMLIVDVCTEFDRKHIKGINDVPIMFWWSSCYNYFVYHFGPDGSGGLGPAFRKSLDTISDIKELNQANEQIWGSTSDELAHTGDLRPMHQYEHICSRLPAMPGSGDFTRAINTNVFKKADGHLICSGEWLEPEARKIVQSYFDDTLKTPTYGVNLRVSARGDEATFSSKQVETLSPPAKELLGFLDDALEKHGAQSVLYLSWGTTFAPFTAPWQADVFLDVMIENKRPFVMSSASMAPIMNPGLEERFEKARKAGICATAPWVPQEAVLQHKAVGAFITHGGWNSTCEAIGAAKPMIFWPFLVDQPFIASLLSDGPEAPGWQLYETRGAVSQYRPYHFSEGPRTSESGETIPVPTGTPEAVRAEFERILIREAARDSPELKKRKGRMVALRKRFIESTQPGGETHQAISDLLIPLGCTIRT
ncbi:hypothetical protein CF326_g1194 [Tilletia indica]|nr:hypothetical protein CF326_g1194 [Tilletia indica]